MNRFPQEEEPLPGNTGEGSGSVIESGLTPEASHITKTLMGGLWSATSAEGMSFSSFDLMQALTEFNVQAIRSLEKMPGMPPEFRSLVLKNTPLNLLAQDAADRGVDLTPIVVGVARAEADGLLIKS